MQSSTRCYCNFLLAVSVSWNLFFSCNVITMNLKFVLFCFPISLVCASSACFVFTHYLECGVMGKILGYDADCFTFGYYFLLETFCYRLLINSVFACVCMFKRLLVREARNYDRANKRCAGFICKLATETLLIAGTISAPVAATEWADQIAEHGGLALCGWLLASITFTCLALMDAELFSSHDAVCAVYLTVAHTNIKNDILDLFTISSTACIAKVIIFLFEEYNIWQANDLYEARWILRTIVLNL